MPMRTSDDGSRRLPGWLLARLYPDGLITAPAPAPAGAPAAGTLGGNARQVLVLVCHPGATVLPDADLAFLLNILKACRLGLPDVRVVNTALVPEAGHEALARDHRPRTALLFGVTPADIGLPLPLPAYQVQAFQDVRYLCGPALGALSADADAKRRLWAGLRQLFTP